jgi:hypothetical protein
MGIRDRDYMKRPSDDDDERDSEGEHGESPDSKAEEFLSRFLERNPRFLLYVGIGLGALVVVALAAAKFSGMSN